MDRRLKIIPCHPFTSTTPQQKIASLLDDEEKE
jgi:hypothetical protein